MRFLAIAAYQFGLCLLLYTGLNLPLRALEFALARGFSPVQPAPLRFARDHGLACLGVALFSPAMVYISAGLVYAGGKFRDVDDFAASGWFWGTAWLAGILLPVQFHYQLNRRMYGDGPEQKVSPEWLPWLWGANSLVAATLVWVPFWLGWLPLAP